MSKTIDVRVTTFTSELNLIIPTNSTGQTLFDKIAHTLGLHETWYFGIVYVDVNEYHRWLKLDKKVSKIKVRNKKFMKFNFLVKYYPEDVSEELIQNLTISLFYFQIRENILRGDIFCPPETALLLASLSCQVKFGDFDPQVHKQGFFVNDRILPDRILQQYRWSISQWEEILIKWYAEHAGMFPEEAMLEYLKLAQDLEMYGISYFLITNKKGSKLYLGVDALGINIYKHNDRLTPKIGFPWSEIKNISFRDRKFVIKSLDKASPDFVFYTQESKVNKNILAICSGNHALCVRRRNEESIVVQQMKEHAQRDRIAKSLERERLLNEKKAREEAQQRVWQMEKELEKKQINLAKSSKNIESCFETCEDIRKRIESCSAQNIHNTDEENDNTSNVEDNKAMDKDNKIDLPVLLESSDLKVESPTKDFDIPITRIKIIKGSDLSKKETKEYDHEMSILNRNSDHRIPIERRRTVIDSSITLQSHLKSLEDELKCAKIPQVIDDLDSIYEANKAQGMTKFQTLKQIRLGNTKKRVDAFESL